MLICVEPDCRQLRRHILLEPYAAEPEGSIWGRVANLELGKIQDIRAAGRDVCAVTGKWRVKVSHVDHDSATSATSHIYQR